MGMADVGAWIIVIVYGRDEIMLRFTVFVELGWSFGIEAVNVRFGEQVWLHVKHFWLYI